MDATCIRRFYLHFTVDVTGCYKYVFFTSKTKLCIFSNSYIDLRHTLLLQNPDIVLVHYLNVPYPDDSKLAALIPNIAFWTEKKEWTREELLLQLKPMYENPGLESEYNIITVTKSPIGLSATK